MWMFRALRTHSLPASKNSSILPDESRSLERNTAIRRKMTENSLAAMLPDLKKRNKSQLICSVFFCRVHDFFTLRSCYYKIAHKILMRKASVSDRKKLHFRKRICYLCADLKIRGNIMLTKCNRNKKILLLNFSIDSRGVQAIV